MFTPLIFRRNSRVDPRLVFLAHMLDTPDDPIPLQFGARRAVAESGRALRTVEEEHVWEIGGRHAEVSEGAFGPFRFEGLAVDAFDVDLGEAAGDGVEAGGEDEDVELVEA